MYWESTFIGKMLSQAKGQFPPPQSSRASIKIPATQVTHREPRWIIQHRPQAPHLVPHAVPLIPEIAAQHLLNKWSAVT